MIFSRLQRGKPLSLGERLNAKHGDIVNCMRLLENHSFMRDSVPKNRYRLYTDTSRMLLYAKYGAKDSGSESLCDFFEKNSDLSHETDEFKSIIATLNFLEQCFPAEPGNYRHLEKHTWVLTVFTMVYELRKSYSLLGKHSAIGAFIKGFHSKVYNEDFRKSKINYQRFYDRVRGGWSEKLIAARRDILIEEFLMKFPLPVLDDSRILSNENKIALFSLHPTCERCGVSFKDYGDAEYQITVHYIDGGKTAIENTMVLCKDCHSAYHNP
jgi:5-methylcytosine-specific restriction endonuclease McrA